MNLLLKELYIQFKSAKQPLIDITNQKISISEKSILMGPSGSGKTTFLRLLSGWFIDDDDTLTKLSIADSSSTKMNPTIEVRLVGSHASLLPWLTIEGNLKFLLHKRSHADLDTYLQALGFDISVRQLYPYELSLGMYKRIELLIACLSNACLILIDELFASLDIDSRILAKEFLNQFKESCMSNKKFVISTHDDHLASWLDVESIMKLDINETLTITGIVEK